MGKLFNQGRYVGYVHALQQMQIFSQIEINNKIGVANCRAYHDIITCMVVRAREKSLTTEVFRACNDRAAIWIQRFGLDFNHLHVGIFSVFGEMKANICVHAIKETFLVILNVPRNSRTCLFQKRHTLNLTSRNCTCYIIITQVASFVVTREKKKKSY